MPNEQTDVIDTNPNEITTAMAVINVAPAITETGAFQEMLQTIPRHVAKANNLLAEYRKDPDAFIESVDEDEVTAQLKDMAEVSTFARSIDKSRKEIKAYMNTVRDNVLGELDKRLEGAQFGELERAQADIKQLKKDVDTDRREKRWGELRVTFEANVERYPLIGEYAPEMADFSRFKMLFPKLVSGGKTVKVKEADHKTVNETVYAWNTGLELIVGNEWGLDTNDLNKLLQMFKQAPSVDTVTREGRQLKSNAEAREKARIEAENRRIEQEKQAKLDAERRQAELEALQKREEAARKAQDAAAQKRAEVERQQLEERARQAAEAERARQAQYAQFGGTYPTIFKESYPQFMAYLFANPAYHDVHASAKTKAMVVYDIMRQTENPDSVVSRETHRDPQKVLDLVRYMLDA